MYVCIYLYIFYIYFIDFYVIFNEKSKKMKKMRVRVRECGGAPPVFVDDLFCKPKQATVCNLTPYSPPQPHRHIATL